MKRILPILIFALIILYTKSTAQTTLSGELRTRPELRYGYKQLPDSGSKVAFLVSQRSRITLNMKKEKYSVGLSLQDIRVWGDEQKYSSTGIQGDDASIDLKEAWFSYNFNKEFSFKAGRQEFKYGDQRLLGARNWNQYGMSYDAVLVSYKGLFRCDAGVSYNNTKEIDFQELYATDKMKTLNFLYVQKEFFEKLDIYGLYILSGMQNPNIVEGILFKNTMGLSAILKGDNIELNANGYYQTGLNKDSTKVSAFLLSGYAAYSVSSFEFTFGADIISGQNAISTDSSYLETDHRFDILYGARHSFNGDIDQFSNLNSGTGGGGLVDVYLSAEYSTSKNLSLKATYHYFQLQNNVWNPESITAPYTALDSYLGSELDCKLSYKVSGEITIDLGYSIFKASESLYTIRKSTAENRIPANWVWIMITCKPVFYTSEK